MKKKTIYRVIFVNQEKVYEVYAKNVGSREMFGFLCIEDLIFGETSSVVVDPGQERLRNEFYGVKRVHVPLHALIRVDEVEREGLGKVTELSRKGNVSQFPTSIYTAPPEPLA